MPGVRVFCRSGGWLFMARVRVSNSSAGNAGWASRIFRNWNASSIDIGGSDEGPGRAAWQPT